MNNEPVAWIDPRELDMAVSTSVTKNKQFDTDIPLYTHPTDAQINKYKQALESIANEQVELSHDKIKWQNADHIKWAREALK
jgi:hypothetical protein